MTKPKYTPEERILVLREKAKKQMLAQWERKRQETGKSLGYFGGHTRVWKARGSAKTHLCDTCGKQALHWAHIHDTSYDSPENYRPMCQPCHWAYDGTGKKSKAATTHESRSSAAKLAWSRRSPEKKAALYRKAWEVRHANLLTSSD